MENKTKIIDYLSGRHSIYTREQFEEMLQNDSELMKEYNKEKKTYEMVMAGNIHQKLRTLYKADSHKPKSSKYWMVAAALVLVIGLGMLALYYTQDSSPLYDQYYSPDHGLPTYMGDDYSHEMDDAMVDYKVGKYAKAQAKFEALYQSHQSDTLAYYIAQSAMAQDDMTQAQDYLEHINKTSTYYEDAQWYEVMIALKNENLAEARERLENGQWDKYQSKSEQLKSDLK